MLKKPTNHLGAKYSLRCKKSALPVEERFVLDSIIGK